MDEGILSALYELEVVDREGDTVNMLLLVWLSYGPSDRLIWLNIVSYDASTFRESVGYGIRIFGTSVFAIDGSLNGTFTDWMNYLHGKVIRLQCNRGALIAGPLSRLRQVGFNQARYRHAVSPDGMTDVVADIGVCSAIVLDRGQVEVGSDGSRHTNALYGS